MNSLQKFAALAFVFGLLSSAGCYSDPTPECAFLCGTGGSCPDGYSCRLDGFCKRDDVEDDFSCKIGVADASANIDAPEADGAGGDAAPADAAADDATPADASPADAAAPDAPPPDAAAPDAPPPDAAAPDAPPPDAAGPDAPTVDAATPDASPPDAMM